MQVNRIMVPAGLGGRTGISLEFAVFLARQLNVKEVILLGEAMNTTNLVEQMAKKYSDDHVNILPVVKNNDSTVNLAGRMQEYDANLLICGSNDTMGEVGYPMIVIKDGMPRTDIQTIVLALDLEEDDQRGIEEIIGFANALQARLELVFVRTNNNLSANDAINGLQQLAKNRKIQNYSINVSDSQIIEDGLEGFAQKVNPDMIAVISQGKGKLHKLIYGSTTEEMSKAAEVPFFICKAN
jgi:nucleotide-binding universal stress UspA family protein